MVSIHTVVAVVGQTRLLSSTIVVVIISIIIPLEVVVAATVLLRASCSASISETDWSVTLISIRWLHLVSITISRSLQMWFVGFLGGETNFI